MRPLSIGLRQAPDRGVRRSFHRLWFHVVYIYYSGKVKNVYGNVILLAANLSGTVCTTFENRPGFVKMTKNILTCFSVHSVEHKELVLAHIYLQYK